MARDLVDILMDKGAVQMILGYGWTIWEVWAANSWNGRTPGRQWWFHGERYNHVQCPGMCSSFRVLKMILLVKFGRSVHDCGRSTSAARLHHQERGRQVPLYQEIFRSSIDTLGVLGHSAEKRVLRLSDANSWCYSRAAI